MGMGPEAKPISANIAGVEPANSARSLYWRLVLLYIYGTLVAVAVVFSLAALGLELRWAQWMIFFYQLPFAVAFYTIPDMWLISKHYRPLGEGLRALDSGNVSDPNLIGDALARALNLPYLSAMRVTFLHGPLASIAVLGATLGTEFIFKTGFFPWQAWSFAATALFFASPTHAIFEYFAVRRELQPVVVRLTRALGNTMPQATREQLIAVPIKTKLLYLAVFVTSMPLLFFAFSMVFKIDRIFETRGIATSLAEFWLLYAWIIAIVLICMVGAVVMAVLTASEVSQSAQRLILAMGQVESGQLEDVQLDVVSADEYADINRGFQHMVEALREEQHILAISQELSGELQLDFLIARVMRAATELLNAERSTVFVHEARSNTLFSLFAEGDQVREIRIKSGQGIAGAVFTTGQLENIPDAYLDPRFDQSVDKSTGYRTRSILCAPISNKAGGRIGVTQVLNKRNGGFTAKDEARLRAFSAQIAVCLENAQLFDDVLNIKNYNDSILKSVSNGIVTLDVDNVIVTANEAALRILGTNRNAIIGQSSDYVFRGANSWIADNLDRARATGRSSLAVDAEIAIADGAPATVNLTAAPLIDASEDNIGSMLVLDDITREKRVRSTMARYMSQEVADQLMEAGEDALVGKDQLVSVLFSDVRGFTSIAETVSARETVALLNAYFTDMVDVIFANGGILDKYIGDAMMALFGAPFAGPDDAAHAIKAANEMMTALTAFNLRRVTIGQKPLDIGLGINTGDVIVGNIGSTKRLEYTVIGDAVNLASRLEGANKHYGTKILFSEYTMRHLTDTAYVREIDTIRVKGKDVPAGIYETLAYRAGEPGLEVMLANYTAGREAYCERRWVEAADAFTAALSAKPNDQPSQIYLQRVQSYIAAPPPEDWDGVWSLASK
jgi:adenylate cyclase